MSASVASISNPAFSPQSSPGVQDTTAITVQHSGSGTDYNVKVLIESGSTTVRTLDAAFMSLGGTSTESVTWDGKNASGAFVPDGVYNVVVQYNSDSPSAP